ncbi:glycoside hydrolase family 19 protein [Nonomuraea sp. NPDC049646]|uniref:glycoside hydrolase family 19 protein n=1 Tax=unclassified Nonomuraea TaxID=2593643 RepID=UPI0037BAB20C
MRRSLMLFAAALLVAGVLSAVVPAPPAGAATCATPWNASTAYNGGAVVSSGGHNWSAKWWTQNETPGTAAVWADQGACGGGGGTPTPGCDHPNWVAGRYYATGTIVRYTDGNYYIAVHDNPGYDPVISTWYWDPYACDGGGGPTTPPDPGGFVVSQAQFDQMFPGRNSFYSYSGLTTAIAAFPAFAGTGSATVRKQEAAAFLANVSHETGGLVYIVEQNTANYPHYCDATQPYGCPAGQAAYYGRGPIQLSWNFNYKAAGDALGINLLNDPWQVERNASVAWKTALWYWMTQNGPGTMTPHDAMVNSRGFGETIRSINGSLECNGGNPGQVQSRVNAYQRFTQILGVAPGGNLSC